MKAKMIADVASYKPKGRNVTSTNPRKKAIMAAFKAATGATRVTLVKQVAPNTFQAHCMRMAPHGDYASLGFWEITIPECFEPKEGV